LKKLKKRCQDKKTNKLKQDSRKSVNYCKIELTLIQLTQFLIFLMNMIKWFNLIKDL